MSIRGDKTRENICEETGLSRGGLYRHYDSVEQIFLEIVNDFSVEQKDKALQYRQEHFDNGENIINGSELFDKTDTYEEWLQAVTENATPETVNPNWVLTDTFFAVDEQEEIVGMIDLRHTLNDFLINLGNCGYSVRPSMRNKGYATKMLRQILEVSKKAGMDELYLSVERNNIPSIKNYHEKWRRL